MQNIKPKHSHYRSLPTLFSS